MPKDTAYKNYPRAQAGVASIVASASAPASTGGGGLNIAGQGTVACDTCGLSLPRKADHIDVASHPCYRGFTITLTPAGQMSLA